MLRQACRAIKRLHDAGYDWLTLSVNVSAVQFAQPQLVAQISSVLAATGLAPEFLTVEITESVLMEDAELATGTLRALKQQGIKVAVDDFGTGYSSLAYLKRFSIDILKIDKRFIRDVSVDPDSAAIVSAIVALAKSLKLDVVAEDVDPFHQWLAFFPQPDCGKPQRGAKDYKPERHDEDDGDHCLNVSSPVLATPMAACNSRMRTSATLLLTSTAPSRMNKELVMACGWEARIGSELAGCNYRPIMDGGQP